MRNLLAAVLILAACAALPACRSAEAGTSISSSPGRAPQVQTFTTTTVDLTTTPTGIAVVPAKPGYFFVPAGQSPLSVSNVAWGGTMTTAPTIRIGNTSTHDNYVASGTLDVGAFGADGGTTRTTRPAIGNGGLATLADMAAPIVLDVQTAATGSGGFAWTVRLAISGTFVPAF
jgi:hypothetical protein